MQYKETRFYRDVLSEKNVTRKSHKIWVIFVGGLMQILIEYR